MDKPQNILLTEKKRPTDVTKLIAPERIISRFINGINSNMLFYGKPGTGKTTAAKALIKTFGHEALYLNGSTDNGIDIVRERITDYAERRSLLHSDKHKVIFIDECDGFTKNGWQAMRNTIEKYHNNVRFIMTCNDVSKIPDFIMSRFETICFDLSTEERDEILKAQMRRIKEICTEEGIKIEKAAVVRLVKTHHPDMRRMLNDIQSFVNQGVDEVTEDMIHAYSSVYTDIYKLILAGGCDPIENYKYVVSNYSSRCEDIISSLNTDFIAYVVDKHKDLEPKLPQMVMCVAKYQYMSRNFVDQVINTLACIYELQSIIDED